MQKCVLLIFVGVNVYSMLDYVVCTHVCICIVCISLFVS